MTNEETKAVEETIRSIYGMFHTCRLSNAEAKAMKLKAGRLCDTCESLIDAHMQDISDASSPQPTIQDQTNESP